MVRPHVPTCRDCRYQARAIAFVSDTKHITGPTCGKLGQLIQPIVPTCQDCRIRTPLNPYYLYNRLDSRPQADILLMYIGKHGQLIRPVVPTCRHCMMANSGFKFVCAIPSIGVGPAANDTKHFPKAIRSMSLCKYNLNNRNDSSLQPKISIIHISISMGNGPKHLSVTRVTKFRNTHALEKATMGIQLF